MNCLICQQSMIYTLSLADVIYRPYSKQVVCLRCLNRDDFYGICHERFYIQRDYRFSEAWCQKLQKEYRILCHNKLVVAKESMRVEQDDLYHDTHRILKLMGIRAYVLCEKLPKDLPMFSEHLLQKHQKKDMVVIDYNGITDTEWQMLQQLAIKYNRGLTRISIWGECSGTVES